MRGYTIHIQYSLFKMQFALFSLGKGSKIRITEKFQANYLLYILVDLIQPPPLASNKFCLQKFYIPKLCWRTHKPLPTSVRDLTNERQQAHTSKRKVLGLACVGGYVCQQLFCISKLITDFFFFFNTRFICHYCGILVQGFIFNKTKLWWLHALVQSKMAIFSISQGTQVLSPRFNVSLLVTLCSEFGQQLHNPLLRTGAFLRRKNLKESREF